jgi:tetratricopeptide (TPR) repeat protein
MARLPFANSPARQIPAGRAAAGRVPANTTDGAARSEIGPLLAEGGFLQAQGHLARAAECYRKVLSIHPNHPDALQLLGAIALSAADVDGAIALLKRAIAGKPTDAAARCNLANAFLQKHDIAEAEKQLRRALKLAPAHIAARCLQADCKAASGEPQRAREIYEDALKEAPENPQALIGCAHLCTTLGDIAAARTLYGRALALPRARPIALAGLASSGTFKDDSPEAVEIGRYLRASGLAASEYMALHYAAGKIADDAGRHEEAIVHYSEAKKYVGLDFDIAAHLQIIAKLKAVFTPEFFAARRLWGDPSERPVFIVGMPRSGTTLTEQVISNHSDTAGADELAEIWNIAGSLGFSSKGVDAFAKRVTALTSPQAKCLARDYLSVLNRISDTALRVTDKMPHNFLYLGLIRLLFPNARIIHCRRDPLDTCASCFTTHLQTRSHPYTADLKTLGEYYRSYVELMNHWRRVLPGSIFDSDYETLIAAPEEQSRKLLEFVGLAWDPAVLLTHESARPVRTASRLQVRQPLYSTSVGRWRRYEKHLGPLIEALGDLAKPEATATDRP